MNDISTLAALERDFRSQGTTVVNQLLRWVKEKGDQCCLYYGEDDISLTYQEFNCRANQVAHGLAGMGIGKGDRVSILSRNHYVSTLVMFATWKLGALYCPINNGYKGDLLSYIINDTNPKVLFMDQRFVPEVNAIKDEIDTLPQLLLHRPAEADHDYDPEHNTVPDAGFDVTQLSAFDQLSEVDPDVEVLETDLANIIYTSGTTGNPKGVVHNHKWMHGYIYVSLGNHHPDDVLYNDMPLYHVGGACFNVVRAIWQGCKLGLWDRFSPNDFWNRIRKCGATGVILMDVMMDWLMKAPPSPDDRNNSLRLIGMNPLPSNHNEICRRFGIDFVGAGYGSTELGVGFSGLIDQLGDDLPKPEGWHRGYSREEIRQSHIEFASDVSLINGANGVKKGFMGLPSPMVEVKVVDNDGKPVPPGVTGHVGFRHKLPDVIFREYFNKPEATSDAMRDGWFFPNDLVSYDENNCYYFEDRKQGFIRVRGENLSAG